MVIVKKELVEDKNDSENHSKQQDDDYYLSQFLETRFENPVQKNKKNILLTNFCLIREI